MQGNPLINEPNGELLSPNPTPFFGSPIPTTFFADDWRNGWGNRPSNWEITASIQQELAPGLSLDVGYFRRSWIHFFVEDDQDARCGRLRGVQRGHSAGTPGPEPGPAGSRSSLYDQRPGHHWAKPDTLFTVGGATSAARPRTGTGFDITIDGRLENLLIQGGVSTGAASTNNCDILVTALPEIQFNERACHGRR